MRVSGSGIWTERIGMVCFCSRMLGDSAGSAWTAGSRKHLETSSLWHLMLGVSRMSSGVLIVTITHSCDCTMGSQHRLVWAFVVWQLDAETKSSHITRQKYMACLGPSLERDTVSLLSLGKAVTSAHKCPPRSKGRGTDFTF